jgi:hypothetical protein
MTRQSRDQPEAIRFRSSGWAAGSMK